jgi:hypothetical protein
VTDASPRNLPSTHQFGLDSHRNHRRLMVSVRPTFTGTSAVDARSW